MNKFIYEQQKLPDWLQIAGNALENFVDSRNVQPVSKNWCDRAALKNQSYCLHQREVLMMQHKPLRVVCAAHIMEKLGIAYLCR